MALFFTDKLERILKEDDQVRFIGLRLHHPAWVQPVKSIERKYE